MAKDYTIRSKDGKWLKSHVFRQEAIRFEKNGYYCLDREGSAGYTKYWDTQLYRCTEGYEVGGHKITGHHYQYLNFTKIQVVEYGGSSKARRKRLKFPDFWDGDYDYYWCLEIAKNGVAEPHSLLTNDIERQWYSTLSEEDKHAARIRKVDSLQMKVKPHPDYLEGGNHMIVGKSRRKGYSYKNAAICANVYNTVREALTVIGAFDKKYLYPKGTMGMASNYLSYLNKFTAWAKAREYVDVPSHRRASFREMLNGVPVESGYMSEIMAVTFKDNPEAARGKDALYVLFEEAGVFPNLEASFNATAPGLTAGKYITGQILIFGTGGDMESGTVDFSKMFYSPMQYGLMPFVNIWDENAEGTYCGFFHPVYLNMEGYYDAEGNSDIDGAKKEELDTRQRLLSVSTSSSVLQDRVQEYPMCPAEAFLTVSSNDFPVVELRARYNKIIRESLHIKMGQPCYLTREEGRIYARPDLDNVLDPLWTYKPKNRDYKGAVVIYERPIANPPTGLYKMGFDPYRQQQSAESVPSMGTIYVYKGREKFSFTRDTIVASYIGRPYSPDDVNRIAELLAEFYNAEIMHENEVTHVKAYFEKKKKLHLLASQPDKVISKSIKASKVARIWGIHMIDKLKDAGEKYIKEWLLTERDFDENGDIVYNLDTLYDPALMEELILYNRKGNFDRVMAFMMLMFSLAEEDENKIYDAEEIGGSNIQDLLDMMNRQYKNVLTSNLVLN